MRIYLIILIFTFCVSCDKYDYRNEINIMDCLYKTCDKYEVDIKTEFHRFEKFLKNQGAITDDIGESYYGIFENFVKDDYPNFDFEYSLYDSIKHHSRFNTDFQQIQLESSECIQAVVQSDDYRHSKLFTLNTQLDSIRQNGLINPYTVSTVIVNNLSPKDFEQDYYRMTALLTIIMLNEFNNKINVLPQTKNIDISSNALIIRLNSDNEVYINNILVDTSKLKRIVKKYVTNNTDKNFIVIKDSHDTKYKLFVKTQNFIEESIRFLRDSCSRNDYGKSFTNLLEIEKAQILKRFPINISIK